MMEEIVCKVSKHLYTITFDKNVNEIFRLLNVKNGKDGSGCCKKMYNLEYSKTILTTFF